MRPRTRRPTFVAIAVLPMALSGIGACTDQGPAPVVVYNRTGTEIHVFADDRAGHVFEVTSNDGTAPEANSVIRSDLFPGGSCSTRADLVARDTTGKELARTTGQICPGDDWLVDASGFRRSQPPSS
jgi:hypothetical protein